MIFFFIKKTFLDGWDHIFSLVAMNLVTIVIFAATILPGLGMRSVPVTVIGAMIGMLFFSVHELASAVSLRAIADYKSMGFKDYLAGISQAWSRGLILGIFRVIAILFLFIAFPFYSSMEGLMGILALGVLFWTALLVMCALQWFPAVCALLPGSPRKQISKCFLIFFDNTGLSVFLFIYNLLSLGLSAFLAFMAPGSAGINLALVEALRLRLYKYDWLETNPQANRKKIPWEELLREDLELTGKRSLKSLIFPWKD